MSRTQELAAELRDHLDGDVRTDPISRRAYSVDASIYEIEPQLVVCPKTAADIATTIKLTVEAGLPLHARGAATGIVGGCLGQGVVVDTSRYMDTISDIDLDRGVAICEPGVVQDTLNAALSPHGYRLGPDTSTGNRATVGGMVGNNSAGARSLRYGCTAEALIAADLVLSTGELIHLTPQDRESWHEKRQQPTAEGRIYRGLWDLRLHYADAITRDFPQEVRRASGYNLLALIEDGGVDPCHLLAGSEGSLGITSSLTFRIVPKPAFTGIVIIHFCSIEDATQTITELLSHDPLALEMIDDKIIAAGKQSPSMRNRLDWLQDEPGCLFVAEFDGDTPAAVRERCEGFAATLHTQGIGLAQTVMTDSTQMDNVWALRKSGLGLLMSRRSYSRALAFVEDISMPADQVHKTLGAFRKMLTERGHDPGIYGHVGAGTLHIRPYVNIRDPHDLQEMEQLMVDAANLLHSAGGVMSGEHGDGLLRSWLNERTFGPELYEAFCQLKSIFDPCGLMNPGKVVATQSFAENLRASPETVTQDPDTFLDFSDEGGFALSADLCNGNGACRKGEGLMCPSFQATGSELETTRARAQALRSLVNSGNTVHDLADDGLHEVLDLCLECKGCKTECPSQVDMAKMKSEALYHRNQKRGIPLRTRLFTSVANSNKLLAPMARISNWMVNSALSRRVLTWLGIASQRQLPQLAPQRFSALIKTRSQPQHPRQVVLVVDTYTEFNHPEVGLAAVKVLNAIGYSVILIPWSCCGRPMISKGLLEQAQIHAKKLIEVLLPYAQQNLPITCLEPSCLSALADDYRGLLHTESAEMVAKACTPFDVVVDDGQAYSWQEEMISVQIHGHCHHKALEGMGGVVTLLNSLPGVEAQAIDSGCCGMAGSFGYEAEHYNVSMAIGEDRLFPAVRKMSVETAVIADGFSCRSQIHHGTGRDAMHLAEFLASRL